MQQLTKDIAAQKHAPDALELMKRRRFQQAEKLQNLRVKETLLAGKVAEMSEARIPFESQSFSMIKKRREEQRMSAASREDTPTEVPPDVCV